MDYFDFKKYIRRLLENQNNTNIPALQDVYTQKDYERLLKPVLEVIKKMPYGNLSSLRIQLFLNSSLKDIINSFVYETQITPGLLLDFGTKKNRDTILCGNKQEVVFKNGDFTKDKLPIEKDTIFDLASTSKLFTSIAILYLQDEGLIDVFEPVIKYAPEFNRIGNTTIYDLLKFRVNISTDTRVDNAKNPDDALNILYTVHPTELKTNNAYTDMGAMTLRIVVENVTHMPFYEFLNSIVFRKLGMDSTFLNVPKEQLGRVANENYSTIVFKNGKFNTRFDNIPGTPHDPKANAIGEAKGIAPGHAGLFSSKDDMIKFANALINEEIISKEALYSISETETGFVDKDSCTRFYGSLVYLKQVNPNFLSVYPPLSGKSFMSPGFAGTQLVIDPINKITLFVAGPRLHNRIYQIDSEEEKKVLTDKNNKRTYTLNNGEEKIVCNTYTAQKELLVTLALNLSLQYQLLEKLRPNEKEMHLVRELN